MICDIGLTEYEIAYRMQRDLVARRKLGEVEDSLIITEHEPVFTIGRLGDIENLLVDSDELERSGIRVVRTDRGGDITCHAPGQIVAYPVIDLKSRGRDLHRYLRELEQVGIAFLARYGIDAVRIEGKTGVWAGSKKIVSIGIGASDWVTYHGMSVNIANDLGFFSLINACGMTEVEQTSVELLLARPISMEEAKAVLTREFYRIFKIRGEMFAH